MRTADLLAKSSLQSGIRIDTSNSQVEARILNPPTLSFGKGKRLVPDKGNFDVRQEICDPLTFKKEEWALIYNMKEREKADDMVESFKKAGQTYGIIFQDPIYFEVKS